MKMRWLAYKLKMAEVTRHVTGKIPRISYCKVNFVIVTAGCAMILCIKSLVMCVSEEFGGSHTMLEQYTVPN